jgi:DNA (cytosine-5)-methyltransferase 1
VTAGEALQGLVTSPEPEEVLRGTWGHLLPGIPPGDNYLYYTTERGHPDPVFRWRSRYWSFLLKLSPDRPSPTIQAQPGPNVGPSIGTTAGSGSLSYAAHSPSPMTSPPWGRGRPYRPRAAMPWPPCSLSR